MGFLSSVSNFLGSSTGGLLTGALDTYIGHKQEEKYQNQQKKLLNSAHQREVQDLRKAGLNPILSARYGGAGSTLSSRQQTGKLTEGIHSAHQNKMLSQQAKIMEKDVQAANTTAEYYSKYPQLAIAKELGLTSWTDIAALSVMIKAEGTSAEDVRKGLNKKLNININKDQIQRFVDGVLNRDPYYWKDGKKKLSREELKHKYRQLPGESHSLYMQRLKKHPSYPKEYR